MFDKYEVLSLLGTGASSRVYLVRHIKLGTNRALKCISKTHSLPTKLSHEADLLKNLKHPGIPIIYDIEEDESYYYIIEEYVDGESLNDFLLHQNNISQSYIMQFGMQLCEILHYLHAQEPTPILYQDLKPEHIILCGEQVKLIDFGIAAYITTRGNEFQNYGTAGFAAPERCREGGDSTVAADVYSVGVVLSMLMEHSNASRFGKMNRIIQHACAKNISSRYQNMEELQRALAKQLEYTCKSDKAKPSGRKHLLPIIAVAGTKPGSGVTHIAVALTSYLNWRGYSYRYYEPTTTRLADILVREQWCACTADNVCTYEYFAAGKSSWDTCDWQQDFACVIDCGSNIKIAQTIDADLLILVAGGRIWETEETERMIEKLRCDQNLVILCNYYDRRAARLYAQKYQKKVFCFPLDEDAFSITREKKKLFETLLHSTGGEKNSY